VHTEGRASLRASDIEVEGETIIVTPNKYSQELDYPEIGPGAPARNVVVDFRRTDYFGSIALGAFLRLWERVRRGNRRMAFCNVSGHEREMLRMASFDALWPVCSSREEALAAVTAEPPEAGPRAG